VKKKDKAATGEETLNPKTLNPKTLKHLTLNPKPQIPHAYSKSLDRKLKSYTLNSNP